MYAQFSLTPTTDRQWLLIGALINVLVIDAVMMFPPLSASPIQLFCFSPPPKPYLRRFFSSHSPECPFLRMVLKIASLWPLTSQKQRKFKIKIGGSGAHLIFKKPCSRLLTIINRGVLYM